MPRSFPINQATRIPDLALQSLYPYLAPTTPATLRLALVPNNLERLVARALQSSNTRGVFQPSHPSQSETYIPKLSFGQRPRFDSDSTITPLANDVSTRLEKTIRNAARNWWMSGQQSNELRIN